ncbi:MAG TPA: hypothetical protein PLN31_09500 [Azoarcus taiwanensis]|nr:hypothetical protein [Azoarcus taiwanensis]
MSRVGRWLDALFERHKFVRRAALIWACALITVVLLRVTTPEALPLVSPPVATIVVAVIGILSTVIGLYQWLRHRDDAEQRELEERTP